MELIGSPVTSDTLLLNILNHDNKPFNGSFCHTIDRAELPLVNNLIFSFHLFEFGYSDIDFFYNDIVDKSLMYLQTTNILPNLQNIYFLYNTAPINLEHVSSKYNLKKIYLNYFLIRSYFTNVYCKNFKLKNWEPKKKEALFLIGHPFRLNRLPVLHIFHEKRKLELLNYSLDIDYYRSDVRYSGDVEQYSKLLSYGSSNNLLNFLNRNQKKIDDFAETRISNINNIFEKSAYTFPDQWFDASLILCMESYFYDLLTVNDTEYNIFSEKFWKTVLSKKPFIIGSYNDHYYDKLEKLGFKNFLKYTSQEQKINTGYKTMNSTLLSTYSKATLSRTESFLNNMEKYKLEIENDIKYNYELWKELANAELQRLVTECPPLSKINSLHLISLFLMAPSSKVLEKKI